MPTLDVERTSKIMIMQKFSRYIVFCLLLCVNNSSFSADTSLTQSTEALKKRVIELNRELYKLEEEILYPTNTQVVVFLAMDKDARFELDSVELSLNDKLATTYLYSEREINALQRGGVQRLYMGSLSTGPHKVTAVFNGRGADEKYFREATLLKFSKGNGSKYLELRIKNSSKKSKKPRFVVKELR